MNILALDTSTGHCSVAILSEGQSYSVEGKEADSQASCLFSLVAQVLNEARLTYAQLDRIAVTTGPGSFTGVRIGLAAAKGIALAAGLPLIGISSLDAIAYEAALHIPAHPILAVLDARRNQVYTSYYSQNGTAVKPAAMVDIAAIRAYAGEGSVMLAGNGASLVQPFLPNALVLPDITIPRALVIAQAAAHQSLPDSTVEAFYIREPDAKAKAAL